MEECEVSIRSPNIPWISLFGNDGTTLATFYPDGKIVRGAGFTTDDESSIAIWDALDRTFPEFLTARNKGK